MTRVNARPRLSTRDRLLDRPPARSPAMSPRTAPSGRASRPRTRRGAASADRVEVGQAPGPRPGDGCQRRCGHPTRRLAASRRQPPAKPPPHGAPGTRGRCTSAMTAPGQRRLDPHPTRAPGRGEPVRCTPRRPIGVESQASDAVQRRGGGARRRPEARGAQRGPPTGRVSGPALSRQHRRRGRLGAGDRWRAGSPPPGATRATTPWPAGGATATGSPPGRSSPGTMR
jgi:hypothetical protein